MLPTNEKPQRQESGAQVGLETPFLEEELFVGETRPEWEPGPTALFNESPFTQALGSGSTTLEVEVEAPESEPPTGAASSSEPITELQDIEPFYEGEGEGYVPEQQESEPGSSQEEKLTRLVEEFLDEAGNGASSFEEFAIELSRYTQGIKHRRTEDRWHEMMTRRAAQFARKEKGVQISDKAIEKLVLGSRWPDVPCENPEEININYLGAVKVGRKNRKAELRKWEKKLSEEGKSLNTLPLAYRSHFGDLQFWHGMARAGKVSNEYVKRQILNQLSEWYGKGLKIWQMPSDALKRQGLRKEDGFFHLGKALHTIQDSYCRSHTWRARGTDKDQSVKKGKPRPKEEEILYFQDYELQDSEKHWSADVWSADKWRQSGMAKAMGASATLISWFVKGKSFEGDVENYLREVVFALADGYGEELAGTPDREFARKPAKDKNELYAPDTFEMISEPFAEPELAGEATSIAVDEYRESRPEDHNEEEEPTERAFDDSSEELEQLQSLEEEASEFEPSATAASSLEAITDEDHSEIISDLIRWEGNRDHLYRDLKGYVTVGIGNLLKTEAAAQRLPFVDSKSGLSATKDQIAAEFRRVGAMPIMRAWRYRSSTRLRLPESAARALASSRLRREFLPGIRRYFPHFDDYPKSAKRAIVDMAWNLGVGGISKFKKLRAACESGRWKDAAVESFRPGRRKERNEWTKQLFVQAGGDITEEFLFQNPDLCDEYGEIDFGSTYEGEGEDHWDEQPAELGEPETDYETHAEELQGEEEWGEPSLPSADEELAAYQPVPAFASKSACKLTQPEARDLVIHYVANGFIELKKPVAFDRFGKPAYPKVGDKVRVLLVMDGVRLVPNNPRARGWRYTGPLDLRMVVLLHKLVQHMKKQWGATEIYWGGLGVGRKSDDRHGKGFAMDFHRAVTERGVFDVLRDWGKQKVSLRDGRTVAKWPETARKTYFRLDPRSGPGAFFRDAYDFLTGEACDSPRSPTTIGDNSYIVHPDHPSPGLRRTHADHIHLEIDR